MKIIVFGSRAYNELVGRIEKIEGPQSPLPLERSVYGIRSI
ncbi:hypothetical protein [Bacteroides uniformis]|nr:hypothetical protein [Bacteroides uniformis]